MNPGVDGGLTFPESAVVAPPAKGLRRKAADAVRWTGVSMVTTTVLQFVQLAVLGRLLGPGAFGLMALVLIVLNFAQLLGQFGLSEAIIQRKNPTREELSSLYWLNVTICTGLFFLLWIGSPAIASPLRTPELAGILPVAAAIFLILPFGFQFRALAQKALRFKLLAGVEVCIAVVSLLVSVVVAVVLDAGVWSLVWGYLAGQAAGAAILVVSGWREGSTRPLLRLRRADMAGYLGFGLYRTGAMSINFFTSRVAQLFVGVLLGTQALGLYSVATNLVLQPILKLNPVLTRVAFPVFSAVQDDVGRLRRGYLEMVRLLMFVSAPLLVGGAAVAPVAVPLLLGEQWTEAVPLVQVLAFYALLRSVGNAGGSLLMARGRAAWGFYWNLAVLLVIPPAVYAASLLGGGAIHIAWALVAVQTMLFLAHYRVFVRNLIGPCFVPYIGAAGVPVLAAAAMGAVVFVVGIPLADLPNAPRLVVQVAVGALLYALLARLFLRKELRGVLSLLPTSRG